MLSALLSVLLLAASAPIQEGRSPAAPPAPASTAPSSLGALFARAQRDPAGVVPLLVAASAEIERLPPKDAALLADTLEPFARRAFFTSERLPDMQQVGLALHTVEKGEVLDRIAAHYKIGTGELLRLNDELDPKKLRVGQQIKVLDLSSGTLEIVVQESTWRLSAWKRGTDGKRVLVLSAPVGLGAADTPTPIGKTTIAKRVLHPDWTHPVTHTVYADGDPENVLGGYWIALDPAGIGKSGIGLHGYTGDVAKNWIEQGASNGCVRMLQDDVDRVYHLALEGTSVEIAP